MYTASELKAGVSPHLPGPRPLRLLLETQLSKNLKKIFNEDLLTHLECPSVTVRHRGHLVHVFDSKIIHLKERKKENKTRVRGNKRSSPFLRGIQVLHGGLILAEV